MATVGGVVVSVGVSAETVVVEASAGQLEDELRLALSHEGVAHPPIESVRRLGGFLPSLDSIVDAVEAGKEVRS